MRKRIVAGLKKSTVLIALLFVSDAYAGWANGWRTITNVYPHDAGVSFNIDGPIIVPAAPCGNRFQLTLGTANYSAKVATLLSLHAQGKRIQIYYDATSTACDIPVSAFISEQ
jgi:hypothetical protein